jgi:XTP/dITP diphosphohydrolase
VKRILLATRSTHKLREIRSILGRAGGLELVSLVELGVAESDVEDQLETAPTFLENARAKALFFARQTGLPTLADDSGLEVAALGNQPGVRTRRFALDAGYTNLSGAELDQANNELLLQRLAETSRAERSARYVCAAVLADDDHSLQAAIGTCTGEITTAQRGHGGFGYDPLFLLPDLGATFAELDPAQKMARSHRARAFRALSTLLMDGLT